MVIHREIAITFMLEDGGGITEKDVKAFVSRVKKAFPDEYMDWVDAD